MPGHNGLFARQFPIALPCSVHSDQNGFYQRRFDLFAIIQLTSQPWVRVLLSLTTLLCTSLPQEQGRNPFHFVTLTKPFALFC